MVNWIIYVTHDCILVLNNPTEVKETAATYLFFVSVTISIRILPLHPKYTDQTPSLGLPYLRRPEEKIGRKASVNEIVKQKRVRLEKREVRECGYLWDVTRSFESGRREPPTGNFYPIAFPCEFDYMWSSRFSLFLCL